MVENILCFMYNSCDEDGGLTMERFTRITHDINVMGGKACIRGTRCTVGMVISQLSEGKSADDLVDDFPYLSHEDVSEALKYAAWVLDSRETDIVSA